MHEAFKDFATQNFPIDRFYPVVKVNSQSSSEAILRATSSDSDAFYFPTPIPATAPVYNPTPLNLKDNKLQQLKDAQRKNHFNVSGRKFKKSLTPPKASSHTAWIISTLIFRPKSTLFYLSRLIKKSQDLYHILFPISSWPIHSSTVSPWSEVLRLATFFASKWKENHRHTFGDQLQCQSVVGG